MLIKMLFMLKRLNISSYFMVDLKNDIKVFIDKILKKNVKYQLAIIDSKFPSQKPLGFRNNEINFLLDNVKDSTAYCMYPISIGPKSMFSQTYGKSYQEFKYCLKKYSKYYKNHKRKIEYLPKRLHKKLVYCYFLSETYTLLPYLNKNKLPFVFVLFPGGMFGIDNESSDEMLKEIFSSPYFKKVIITEFITKKYLLEKKFCEEDRIEEIYTGYPSFTKEEVEKEQKLYYPKDKDTIDLTFCAFKYSPMGYDKGYDLFIDTAMRLAPKYPQLRFHVIGSFDENDIDVSEIRDKIKFYGVLQKEELKKIYLKTDMFITPNRPSALYKGNFDGFPMHGTSIYWGCTILNTDEYKTNIHFKDKEEVVIIRPEINDICEKVEYLINNMDKTYEIGKNGKNRYYMLFNNEKRDILLKNLINNIFEDTNKEE